MRTRPGLLTAPDRGADGQGSLEYLGMMLLVAVLLAVAIVAANHTLGQNFLGIIRDAFAKAARLVTTGH